VKTLSPEGLTLPSSTATILPEEENEDDTLDHDYDAEDVYDGQPYDDEGDDHFGKWDWKVNFDEDNDHDLADQNDSLASSSWLDLLKSLLIVAVAFACLALMVVAWRGCRALGGRLRIDVGVDEPLIRRTELE
jgi:hypothetical protein